MDLDMLPSSGPGSSVFRRLAFLATSGPKESSSLEASIANLTRLNAILQ